jgi:transcription initiation factor TFIID subunit 12
MATAQGRRHLFLRLPLISPRAPLWPPADGPPADAPRPHASSAPRPRPRARRAAPRRRFAARPQTFKLAPEVQAELARLAEDFVSDLVERGCQLAALRRAGTLRAADLAPYLERTHHIRVPGFGGELRPYRRPNASELHRERAAAVRQSAAAAGAGAGAPGGGGGGGAQHKGRGG